MPLNTTNNLGSPTLRRKRKGGLNLSPDVAQTFGNAQVATSETPQMFQSNALQSRASQMAMDLGYDSDSLIKSAESGINATFDQSQNKLARIFALDPGGTKSGTAQNRLETLETGRATTLSQAKQDILSRAPTEQRANIGTLDAFLSSAQQRGQSQALTNSALQNEALQRAVTAGSQTGTFTDPQTGKSFTTEQVRQFNEQLKLQKGQATGNVDGQTTLAGKAQAEVERAQKEQEKIQKGQLTGMVDGQQTLAGKQQEVNDLNAALERAIAQGNATGTFTDPQTGVPQQTLQAEIARAEKTLQERVQNFNEAATIAQQTGVFVDPKTKQSLDTLAKTQQAFEQELLTAQETGDLNGVTTLAARSLALKEAELTGQVGDQKTIAQKALDLQAQIQKGQLALQQQAQAFGQNVTEAELTGVYQKMGNEAGAFQASFNSAQGDENYNPRYDLDGDGKIDFADWTAFAAVASNQPAQTLQAQALQEQKLLREFGEKTTKAGLTGTYEGQQTVQEKQRVFENTMKESQLFVDAPPITLNMDDYQKSFNSKRGDANYREDLDITGDGTVDFTDFIEMAGSGRIEVLSGSMSDPFGTDFTFTYKPEGKMSVIAAQLGLEEKQLGEATRQFNEQFGARNAEFLTNATGYLFDANGNIESKWVPATPEGLSFGQTATFSGNLIDTQTGKAASYSNVSGQVIGTEEVKEGGVNEQRWIIQTSDGKRLTVPTSGVYMATPVSTLERSQQDEQRRQFNAQLDVQVDQFLDQLGLSYETLENEKDATKAAALGQIIAAALGAVGQIRAGGQSLNPFGGGGSNNSASMPFFTVSSGGSSGQTKQTMFG